MKKVKFSWAYLLVLTLAIVCLFLLFTDTNVSGKKTTPDVAITMIQEDKVSDFYAKDGIAKIKLFDSQIKNFPTTADYYFKYTQDTISRVIDAIENQNTANVSDPDKHISWNYEPTEPSFFERIMPILYIGFGLFIIFLIYKMISSSNKGAMTFGKSRARQSSNVKVRFKDIAGADEEKEELKEIVEFLKSPERFTALGARIPKGVLLVGPPGTGKTLLARAVAGESNVPFLSISGSDFVEMFVGVGASRVRDLFEEAKKNTPCIVFIDEIDAVGRQRGAGLGGGNDEREQTLNQLLVEMDGFEANEGIIVLAATNRSDVLDPALLRPGRFDRQIYVHVPDVKGREGIIKIHARNKPIDEDVDFTTLARITSGFTGADLENMLNEAAILAARANRPKIIMEDLTEGINKVIMGPQKKSRVMTENDKKITAYHESGHAILGKMLEYCEPIQEVSIIPRGNAAGYTMSRPDNDDNHKTYNHLIDDIVMTMGGRLAEEIVFGDITTGASSDIHKATEVARNMVTQWGMSKLGFIGFDTQDQLFIGRDYQSKNNYSEKMASEIDAEIKRILDACYKRGKEILTKNRKLLDEMSELLLQKETIYHDEVDMLIAGKTAKEVAKTMDDKLALLKEKQDSQRKQMSDLQYGKELDMKVKTGEMFLKSGIITEQDLKTLKDKRDEYYKSLDEKYKKQAEEKKVKTVEKKVAKTRTKKIGEKSVKTKEITDNEKKSLKPKTKRQTKSKVENREESPEKTTKNKGDKE
mgnify:FL=1